MTVCVVRRASSLIVLSKCSTPCPTPPYKHWKNVGPEDYAVTLLKRSSRSKFMPAAVVFPGGVYHAADSNLAWLDLFEKCGVSHLQIKENFRQPDALRAATYKNLAEEMSSGAPDGFKESPMGPELALRLTALRETFEETGLLLTQPYVNGVPRPPLALTEQGPFPVLEGGGEKQNVDLGGRSLGEWRSAVDADASKFLDLFACSSNNERRLLPWVGGLVEWWGWLTPLIYTKIHFDTVFYTALLPALELQPAMMTPCNESSELMVMRPSTAVAASQSENFWVAPPQLYEFGRLANFRSLEQVREHVRNRAGHGGCGASAAAMDTWQPQVYLTTNGSVFALPGDAWYSEDYSVGEGGAAPWVHCTMEAMRSCHLSDLPRLVTSPEEAEAVVSGPRSGPALSLKRLEVASDVPEFSFHVSRDPEYRQVAPVDITLA